MTAQGANRMSALREHAAILGRLEDLVTADERAFASGGGVPDKAIEEERSILLSRFEKLTAELKRRDAGADSSDLAARAHTASLATGPDETRLEHANTVRAQELSRRTAALLAGWALRRGDIIEALGEIREGRRILSGYHSASGAQSGIDTRC